MASYPPPNQNVAIFNPLNFISGGEGLTLDEGKKFFLQFPDAQGTENMETTNIDGVFTANDQAFFNDTITLEQTDTGEDALNILVDSPGYAIRATTRTDPTTNTQITILPTATNGEINTIVQLGDALIYSTTGDLTGGSMSITSLGVVDEFGIRLNETDEVVEIGGQLELLNNGIKFSDGTTQSTAYTGDGSETLEDVLTTGNNAGNLTITNLASIAGTTYFMGDVGVDTLLSNGTGGAFDFYGGDGGGLTQIVLKVQQSGVSVYNNLQLVGANMEFSDGSIQTTAYTGDGTDTLGDVLDNGNIASQDIDMDGNNLTDVNSLQFGTGPGLLVGETDDTLTISTLESNASVNNMLSYDPATGKLSYCPSAFQAGSINIGLSAGDGVAGLQSVHIGQASGGSSGNGSVGIGLNSGIQQGVQSVAVGAGSGFQIGANCVSVGANAGGNSGGNSICLNATGLGLNPTTSGLFIDPVFYPTFVSGTGTQTFSINPNTGNFNVVDTLKLTQSELAIGKTSGTSQGSNSIAIGAGAGISQTTNCYCYWWISRTIADKRQYSNRLQSRGNTRSLRHRRRFRRREKPTRRYYCNREKRRTRNKHSTG
jgi:hypothetical protein